MSELENDRRTPSLAQLDALARTYSRSVASFLSETEPALSTVLWRKRPSQGAEELEARFLRLAEQYANLERWNGDVATCRIPDPPEKSAGDYRTGDAEELARVVRRELGLGDRPALSLLRVLEEDCGVKVFTFRSSPREPRPARGARTLGSRSCSTRTTFVGDGTSISPTSSSIF